MDRRSWLWRRKSSEKSPGETESSGSISSHSERFSDDQAYLSHNIQSPEVTSKAAPNDEEINVNVKTLGEKLSAALLNISAKEDLVRQHAKVAEEAVSGWEKAESEVLTLKQQLEAEAQKNSTLEDRVGHLDGALKECVRQLRQAREEQEQKIHEAVVKATHEWESTKTGLENQLFEFQAQLQTARLEAAAAVDLHLGLKLETAEKEISALNLELLARAEELELRAIERDLSTQAAEAASKQHLESTKKVAKLEAECRRLKAVARKAPPANDQKSFAASSVCVESFTDSQSDYGERLLSVEADTRKMSGLDPNECDQCHPDPWAPVLIAKLDQFKNEKAFERNIIVPSVEMNLMDDFLEMEKLAAMPETESRSCLVSGAVSKNPEGGENALKAELDSMIHRTAELEEKLEKMEAEKVELEMFLSECQEQLKTSQGCLEETQVNVVELQSQLALAHEMKQAVEVEMEDVNARRQTAESQLLVFEGEIEKLHLKVGSLEDKVAKERVLSAETANKCKKLEDELRGMKDETNLRHAAIANGELKIKQEEELAVAAGKLAECQKTIASLGKQLKSLATLEDFLVDMDKPSEPCDDGSQSIEDVGELHIFNSSDCYMPKGDSETPKTFIDCSYPSKNRRDDEVTLSSNLEIATEKSRSAFGKIFIRSKNGSQNDNQ